MKEMIDKGGTLKVRPARLKEWTQEDTERAIAMRKRGKLIKEIAEILGACECTVISRLKPFRHMFEQEEFKPQKAGPRTYVNSVIREPLKDNWTPSRPGAMDYAKIRSRGL